MKPTQIIVLVFLVASLAPKVVAAQAGEVTGQVPVIEGVERPDSPKVDEAQCNAEARLRQVQPGSAVHQPQVEMPSNPQQPKPQQD